MGDSPFNHVAPRASLSGDPHTAAELQRFTSYHGPSPTPQLLNAWQEQFLAQRLNRAFAVSDHGMYGTVYGWQSDDDATRLALKSCNDRSTAAGQPAACRLYAVNAEIVYPGQQYVFPFRGQRIGPFVPNPEYIYYGPAKAKGLIVWSHGRYAPRGYVCGVNGATSPAWAFVTQLNQDGWDIVRFDRDPCVDDLSYALRELKSGVSAAATLGYRKLVLAGQSRGAIQSLLAVQDQSFAKLVSAVVAVSPADSGKDVQASTLAPQRWHAVVDGLSTPMPLAVFFFSRDEYNPLARESVDYARANWSRTAPNAHIYYNDSPDMVIGSDGAPNGHGGASRPAFARKYAACLATLIDTGEAAGVCAE